MSPGLCTALRLQNTGTCYLQALCVYGRWFYQREPATLVWTANWTWICHSRRSEYLVCTRGLTLRKVSVVGIPEIKPSPLPWYVGVSERCLSTSSSKAGDGKFLVLLCVRLIQCLDWHRPWGSWHWSSRPGGWEPAPQQQTCAGPLPSSAGRAQQRAGGEEAGQQFLHGCTARIYAGISCIEGS